MALTYADAGVDIVAGDDAVLRIKDAAKRTHAAGVLDGLGGFGGMFRLAAMGALEDPVLVSGTDGVGTKLLVAIEADRHETIGQDLVAMCVNDILCLGARPLFFLDYFATGALHPAQMARVVTGIAKACEATDCALLGGETAELPGMYAAGHYDLAGFCVGVVDRKRVIDGKAVRAGDAIVGLPSTGLHSNGYSLARKVVSERLGKSINAPLIGPQTVADVLLEPTALYVSDIMGLLDDGVPIKAMAHITGGGITGNLTRGFPDGVAAKITPGSWEEPEIFDVIRQGGPVEEVEMRKTFNLGVGFALVVAQDVVERVRAQLPAARVIGEVIPGGGEVVYA